MATAARLRYGHACCRADSSAWPWIEWLERIVGLRLDDLVSDSLGMMMAGVADPAALDLGEQLFAALLLGFAMQHYYLDAKIGRVSKDRQIREHLNANI